MKSPNFICKEKDGSLRLCIDYQKWNQVTIENKYPLSKIDGLVKQLWNAKVFFIINLRFGYH